LTLIDTHAAIKFYRKDSLKTVLVSTAYDFWLRQLRYYLKPNLLKLYVDTMNSFTRAISERFRDKELIIKRYINSPSLLYFTFIVLLHMMFVSFTASIQYDVVDFCLLFYRLLKLLMATKLTVQC